MSQVERPARDAARLRNLFGLLTRRKPAVGSTPSDVVHRENKLRLLRYRPRPEGIAHATPVVLVPSLINRHYVLDLGPGRSFAEYMVARGHDVYIIDWGTPGDEDRFVTFDDVCETYLGRCLRIAARGAPGGRVHVLGYCLGGTLAAIHAAAHPERFASLVCLAAPVRFHDEGLLSAWVRAPGFDVGAMIAAYGNVPVSLMQPAFQMLRPTLGLAKAVAVIDRAWDDEFLDGFFAIETWGNDNVAFPGECYRRYIEELYQGDAFARDVFALAGRPARMSAITCPTLAVTFEHDNIVPWKSAAEIVERVGAADRERIHLPGGHVGAVVSKKAADSLWPAISNYWARRDGGRAAASATGGASAAPVATAGNGRSERAARKRG